MQLQFTYTYTHKTCVFGTNNSIWRRKSLIILPISFTTALTIEARQEMKSAGFGAQDVTLRGK